MVSICSQLPPEENPGQDTLFTSAVNGIETGANVQNFGIGDYGLRRDNTTMVKPDGRTSLRAGDALIIFASDQTAGELSPHFSGKQDPRAREEGHAF